MLIDLTPKEIEFIKTGIEVAQFESQLPETDESEEIKNLLHKLGVNKWLLIHGENYFTLVEEYQCSECGYIVSGYPPKECPNCGTINEYLGDNITCRMESED